MKSLTQSKRNRSLVALSVLLLTSGTLWFCQKPREVGERPLEGRIFLTSAESGGVEAGMRGPDSLWVKTLFAALESLPMSGDKYLEAQIVFLKDRNAIAVKAYAQPLDRSTLEEVGRDSTFRWIVQCVRRRTRRPVGPEMDCYTPVECWEYITFCHRKGLEAVVAEMPDVAKLIGYPPRRLSSPKSDEEGMQKLLAGLSSLAVSSAEGIQGFLRRTPNGGFYVEELYFYKRLSPNEGLSKGAQAHKLRLSDFGKEVPTGMECHEPVQCAALMKGWTKSIFSMYLPDGAL